MPRNQVCDPHLLVSQRLREGEHSESVGQWQSGGQTPDPSDPKARAPSLSLASPRKVELVLPKPTARVCCED